MDKELVKKIRNFCKAHGITYCALFGSRARGDQKRGSDIDLLVEFPKVFSLLDIGGMVYDLEEVLGMRVNIMEKDILEHPKRASTKLFRDEIKRDLKILYG